MGIEAVVRLKSTGTLIDKLQRSPAIKLPWIRDLAGARVVIKEVVMPAGTRLTDQLVLGRDVTVQAGRLSQRVMATMIAERLSPPFGSKPAKIIDRCTEDNQGYRAMHVIGYVDGLPVEVQVRTPLQHAWAEVVERLGDRWGRSLRYGEGPDDPDRPIGPGETITRRDVMGIMSVMSDRIDGLERAMKDMVTIEVTLASEGTFVNEDSPVHSQLRQLNAIVKEGREELQATLAAMLESIDDLE